jgi:hypothetical protein
MVKLTIATLVMLTAYVITKLLNIDDFARGMIIMWSYFASIGTYDFISKKQ